MGPRACRRWSWARAFNIAQNEDLGGLRHPARCDSPECGLSSAAVRSRARCSLATPCEWLRVQLRICTEKYEVFEVFHKLTLR
jgi:hypothetical protein